jgi:hypothetical protein
MARSLHIQGKNKGTQAIGGHFTGCFTPKERTRVPKQQEATSLAALHPRKEQQYPSNRMPLSFRIIEVPALIAASPAQLLFHRNPTTEQYITC